MYLAFQGSSYDVAMLARFARFVGACYSVSRGDESSKIRIDYPKSKEAQVVRDRALIMGLAVCE